MSDSDPEGDKLDVKQLLGKCQNKLIKKKLQESYVNLKRNFIKKYKKLSAVEQNQSINNLSLRESYALPLNTTFNTTATSNRPNPKLNIRNSGNPQVTTTTTSTRQKTIKTIRFH